MRAAAFACIVLVATAAAQSAAQTTGPPPQPTPGSTTHQVIVEGATADLSHRADLRAVTYDYELGSPDPVTGGPACGDGRIVVDPVNGTLRFEEGFDDTGCGEASVSVPVPPGARSLTLDFTADRNITEQGQVNPPQHMVQRFILRGPHGAVLATADYFAPETGSVSTTAFTYQLPLADALANVSLAWRFSDDGADIAPDVLPSTPALQRLRATVGNISLSWPLVPLALPETALGEELEQPEQLVAVAHFNLTATLPAELLGNGTGALRMTVRTGAEVVGAHGPAGVLAPADFNVSRSGERLTIEFPSATVGAHGPGRYSVDVLSARSIAPPSPPPPPITLYPLYYGLLLAPVVAAVLATQHAIGYAREARGRYVRSARFVMASVLVVILYFLALAAYSFFVIGPAEMATLPLSEAALLLYAQLILVAIALVLSAFIGTRLLTRNMRRDLEERERQQERLRRSNEELERFAYVASHDLQEPLRKVAGFTALLQRRYKGRLDKDADAMIDYAVDGATRMQALIRDILAYSRVNSGQLDLQVVDVGAVMDLVTADLDSLIKQHKASVSWRGLPTVRADSNQLRQVLQNLVENAIKYRHPKRKPRIDVSAQHGEREWTFRVADNGVGIPKDKADEVFGIFRRLHGREVPGTGIGLAIVRKALERHGGSIRVEPRHGGGSVFLFTLPHAGDVARSSRSVSATRPAPRGRPSSSPGGG